MESHRRSGGSVSTSSREESSSVVENDHVKTANGPKRLRTSRSVPSTVVQRPQPTSLEGGSAAIVAIIQW